MVLINNVLSNILSVESNYCCLCFDKITTDATHIRNQLINNPTQESVDIYMILEYLFKGDEIHKMYTMSGICQACKTAAVNSYKFMKMYEINSEKLSQLLECITDSLNNTVDNICYKSLFILLNKNDFTSQQFYHDQICTPSTAAEQVKELLKLEATVKVGNDIKEDNKSNCHSSKTKYYKPKVKNRKCINYDIPSVPDSELLLLNDNSPHLKCKYCFKLFKEMSNLRRHSFMIHYPRNVKCPTCQKMFLTDEILQEHINKFHVKTNCTECGKHFKNKQTMRKHKINHNFIIMCQDCGRVYKSQDAFKKHKADKICQQNIRKKSEQGTYMCDYCNKSYCNKPYLAKHIKYEHEKAEGYICKFCNKKFYTPSGLKVHTYKHTQEKKFECYECNRRFVTRTSLLYHTRLHTGERPYQCSYCDKAFLSASRRIDHIRRHHMPPSLECDICHSKFKGTGSLLKHKKRHYNPNSRLHNICFIKNVVGTNNLHN